MSTLSSFLQIGLEPWLVGLLTFAFVSSITPGPNNILLAASGARFGLRRTVAHAAGIWAGMVTLLLLAAVGFGAIASTAPSLAFGMQILAAVALITTAVSMLREDTATSATDQPIAAKPWSFWQAVGFQYLNPKALMMAVTAAAMTPQLSGPQVLTDGAGTAAMMIAAFMIVAIPCTWTWVLAGAALRQTLSSPRRKRVFNIVMALLLVATIPLSLAPAAMAA